MRHLLITTSLFLSVAAIAQDANFQSDSFSLARKVQLGGSIRYSHGVNQQFVANYGDRDVYMSHFSISTGIGVFLSQKFLLGLFYRRDYRSYETFENDKKFDVIDKDYFLGPYMRLHQRVNKKILVFEQLDFGFGFGSITPGNPKAIGWTKMILGAQISPGIVYFIHPKIGLETTFGLIEYRQLALRTEDYFQNRKGESKRTEDFIYGTSFSNLNFAIRFYL